MTGFYLYVHEKSCKFVTINENRRYYMERNGTVESLGFSLHLIQIAQLL